MAKCAENGHVTVTIHTVGLCETCGNQLADLSEDVMAQVVKRWIERTGGEVHAHVDLVPEGEAN